MNARPAFLLRLLLLLPFLVSARGEEGETQPAPAPAPEPALHEVRLRGGTILVGLLEPAEFKVKTAFGDLAVPVKDVRRVVFGRKSDPERYQRMLDAIANLAATSQEKRLTAQAYLAKEGRYAAPELLEASTKHSDPEVRRATKELYDAMEIAEDEELPKAEDLLETSAFALLGTLQQKSFKVTVPELGPIDVKREDVAQIRVYTAKREEKCSVDGQQTTAGPWLDTKILLEKDEQVTITASGQITFPNWGGQMFDPEGNMQMGMINGYAMGCLVGRIGESGQMFKVGRLWTGRTERRGILQLAIMLNMRGQPSTGQFAVRIERE